MSEFNNKVAVVTGGGRGIGAAICKRLAQGGAIVAVTDYDKASADSIAAALNSQGQRAAAVQMDVTSSASVAKAVAEIEATLGPIEILVNNAGVSHFTAFLDMSEEEWDQVLTVNLKGVFLTCRAIVPGMAKRKSGRIVNMSSILGKMGEPNFVHYSASKFGVLGLTQSIAAEFAADNITANCVCPGIVETPLWNGLDEEAVAKSDAFASAADVREFVRSRIPLGRTQPVEDIAEMVAFLASDKARNMTGGSYHVDGGMAPR